MKQQKSDPTTPGVSGRSQGGRGGRFKRVAIMSALAVTSLAGLVFAAAPPANTQIGNVATAIYTDASDTSRTVTSNQVITVVQQVSSFTLTSDQSKLAAPGGQVYFPHTIVNTGNGSDTFTLNVVNASGDGFDLSNVALYADVNGDGLPDDGTPIISSGAVAPGASFKFVAVGIVPGSTASDLIARLTVTAAATATPTPATAQTNTDTVTVTTNAVVNVTKTASSNSGIPGSTITYTLAYTNTGNSIATNLTLADPIPAGMTYVANSARWSVTGSGTTLTDLNADAQGTAPDTVVYDFGQTTPGTVTAVISRVQPGETRTVSFQVTVNAAQGAGQITNTANYSYDPGTGTVLGPYPTNGAPYTVLQTASVTVGDATVTSVPQGGTAVFTNLVTNTGNGADTFNITVANSSFPAGTTFQLFKSDGFTPLLDTDGNGIPDTGLVGANGTYSVVVKAILPPGVSGTNVNYTAIVTGTSSVDPTKQDTGTDTLVSVAANSVDLANNLPGGPGTGLGPEAAPVVTNTATAGTTTRFTLYVSNTSTVSDTFNLAASGSTTFPGGLPAGWTVVFRDASNAVVSSTGAINAGGNKLIYADVTVPAGAAPDTTDIYFRVLSPTTGAFDILHDAVTVNAQRSLALSQTNNGQVAPNGSIVYSHTLTNNGNVLEGDGTGSSITLTTANSAANWSSVVYYDLNGNGLIDSTDPVVTNTTFTSNGTAGLSPGESILLLVKVTAPPGAPVNSQNVTTLTATTGNVSYTTTAPAVISTTDTTTVINGDIALVKEQALDSNLDGNPDGAYSSGPITSGALPGKGIRYRITVTNKGTAPATAVRVYDTTPSYTTYTTNGPAGVTGGSSPSVVQVPGNGSAGALEFNVGTLNPGESAVITFGVRIDS